jgi:hypothetical protein
MVILLILFILVKPKNQEGFANTHIYQIKKNAKDAYHNKTIFKRGVNYQTVKSQLPWIDPVSYDDIYKLYLREPLTISNLEEVLLM